MTTNSVNWTSVCICSTAHDCLVPTKMCQTSEFHETHSRSLRERKSLTRYNDGVKREYIANWKQRPQVVQQLKCDFEIYVAAVDEEMLIDS